MTNRVRLTFSARCRFPDIGTSHGTVLDRTPGNDGEGNAGEWLWVRWRENTTGWLPATDLEPVTDQPEEPNQ